MLKCTQFAIFAAMKMLIKNIRGLVSCYEQAPSLLKGSELAGLPILEDAWLAIEEGRIADFGSMADWPGINDWRDLEVYDATGAYLAPGYIDSHTHMVHAGTRESEFVDRINGLTYAEIAERGGGILNSAAKLADTPEEVLFEEAHNRMRRAMAAGTLAFEIKSGYGLTLEAELKMLRVIDRLKRTLAVPVKATFLGAHAIPMRFKGDAQAYVNEIIHTMLPAIADEKLADFIDVFCETGYFSVEQTCQIVEAGARYNLPAKVHINQFTTLDGVKPLCDLGVLSLDHLEVLSPDDLEALKNSNTLPVALPGCSFFLGIPYTPARLMIDAGLPLVLATDYNPGSAPSWNMNTVQSLACTQMHLSPSEAFNASTLNAAAAMQIEGEVGCIAPGYTANLMLTESIPSFDFLPYSFGDNNIAKVMVAGQWL